MSEVDLDVLRLCWFNASVIQDVASTQNMFARGKVVRVGGVSTRSRVYSVYSGGFHARTNARMFTRSRSVA